MKQTKKQINLKESIKQELKIEQENTDYEIAHSNADEILCKFIGELGYQDVVDEFVKVGRWYA